jgi:hypothetical protein
MIEDMYRAAREAEGVQSLVGVLVFLVLMYVVIRLATRGRR